jgi:sugar phosphate isomerase/epimerase
MRHTRRDFGRIALATLPMARGLSAIELLAAVKVNSKFNGVQIGVIAPYSFRGISDPEAIIQAMVEIGLNSVTIQSESVESFAGAPSRGRGGFPGGPPPGAPPGGFPGGGPGGTTAGPGAAAGAGGPGGPGGRPGRGPGFGRRQMTPEEQAAARARAEELRKWRLSASTDKFKAFHKQFSDAGIDVNVLHLRFGQESTDDEIDYFFQMAKAIGAKAISSLDSVSMSKRIGAFADKHRMLVGYHNHSNVTNPEEFCTPQSWETAMSYAKYNGINLDVGHWMAGNNISPVDFMRKYHNRITNLHLKDRKKDQGPNMPWGQGDTPLIDILQTMRREKYKFPADIELEYATPQGSDTVTEVSRCLQYCKKALA